MIYKALGDHAAASRRLERALKAGASFDGSGAAFSVLQMSAAKEALEESRASSR
jgi:hypothetical protein